MIEFILYFVKLRHLNKYLKNNLVTGVESRLNEHDRRKIFGKPYAVGNLAWLLNCIFILVLVLGLSETQECKEGQAPINDWTSAICLECIVSNCSKC